MINKIQNMNGIKIRIGGMAKAIYNKIGKGMRPGRMALGMMLATMLGLVACDEHRDFPDTGMKVGHILCTDGEVMSYEDYNQSGKEAIAVVFHLNRDEAVAGNGYAVYLHDLAPEAFADSIGIVQGTSADPAALTAMRTRLPCMKQRKPLHRWPSKFLIYGNMGRVPMYLRWHRCACCMPAVRR